MRLPINFNTQATFDFENQLKLDYSGTNDEILRRVEAGNVSYPSKGSLIQGAQQLFGIKTQLQFGRLSVTSVLANQNSQRQGLGLQGGSAATLFEFKANDYEENRHFLLSQYFRGQFNQVMKNLPAVTSAIQILQVEVWVTNRNGSTTDTRDIVGLMDLGEPQPYLFPTITPTGGNINNLPYNDANDLFRKIINEPTTRSSSFVTSRLNALGLQPVQDFEKTFGRKLVLNNDYTFDPQLGYVSLLQPLQPDEVLGVAYRYTFNGRIYQVGEFSQDVTPDTTAGGIQAGSQKVLFLKLLKATSQRPNLPIWDLMMKNIYALKTRDGSYLSSLQPTDFELNVLYEEPSLGSKRYLPEGDKKEIPLIDVLRLDRLNNQRDPQPDGRFDYIEGKTVFSQQARIMFPLLEPFGRDLDSLAFRNSPGLKDKYIYLPLYDTIKEIAKTYANLDRYIISGRAKGQSASEISLGAFNVPRGSVTVTAGGNVLKEGIDFDVNYDLGTVKILNQALINSGVPVNVQFENNGTFSIQQRNYLGLRLDYLAKNTDKESLTFGGQVVRIGERPFFQKVSTQDGDPIRNTMFGLDFNYRSELPKLTRLLDKLPSFHTTEMSNIQAYGEGAMLKPGHPPQINLNGTKSGVIYIDDFEGARNNIELRFPLISWTLASTPQKNGLFPEGSINDSLEYGFNRAKLSWYNIEPNLQDPRGNANPLITAGFPREYFGDPYVRAVSQTDIRPASTPDFGQANLVTFDLAYFPEERGPYNYDARTGSIASDGKLLNPQKRWGGIMRGIDQTDFETGNVEFIEFWMLDPFLNKPTSTGGEFYINLGNISEDVLRDGRRQFENGLAGANQQAPTDTTPSWGQVPANPIQVTTAFSNDPADRPFQDVGFDGLTNIAEKAKFADFLNRIGQIIPNGSAAFQKIANDPSSDDFKSYRDGSFDNRQGSILNRYKDINNPHGNSPVATPGATITTAFSLYPDQEDLNRDNTLNEVEEYFQYKIELKPGKLTSGQNYITDVRTFTRNSLPGAKQEKWYLFRIPINSYEKKVGNIPDFKSIRFIRMFLTGFEDSVICRFAKFELVRNQWRRFAFKIDTTGNYTPLPAQTNTEFNVLAVNVEENTNRDPNPGIPYVSPPGLDRQRLISNNNVQILQNEQSMSLQVCNLAKDDVRGVFKNLNLDLRQYGSLSMFIHAEGRGTTDLLADNALEAVIRLGNDMVGNYYEVRIPLKKTNWNTKRDTIIWPTANEMNLSIQRLVALKLNRDKNGRPSVYYSETDADNRSYALLGNPNLGEVRSFFMGVKNIRSETVCTEVWFNELRLGDLDEKSGYAALGRVDIKLADLGTLTLSGSFRGIGFGGLDQRVNERQRENVTQLDAATTLELGKFFPQRTGISIPTYASYSQQVITPEYDPYALDVTLKDKLRDAGSKRDSIRNAAADITTTKTVNFTNVKKNNVSGKKQKPWSVENFDVSYSYTKIEHKNPLIENDELTTHRGGLGYNYNANPDYIEPLKNVIKSKSPWFKLLNDFNFNPLPSLLSFRADAKRQFGAFRPKNVGAKSLLPETFNKYFTFDRYYNLSWNITSAVKIDFDATNTARIDEGPGRLSEFERNRMWNRFFKGGRNTTYMQNATASYVLPTNKLPLLDWTNMRVGYTTKYNWTSASLDSVARLLGNFIGNSQDKNATAEFDFSSLYKKSRFLRAVDWDAAVAPPPPPSDTTNKLAQDTSSVKGKKKKVKKPKDPNQLPEVNMLVKFVARLATSLKRVSVTYSETATTNLAGYLDSTRIFGNNLRSRSPGWDFVFGRQPDTNYINNFARKGLFTRNNLFNQLNRQDFNQRLGITAQLIPLRDLTVDVNLDKTFGKTYSELYKDTTGSSGLSRLSPYASGNFSVSYISFKTLFTEIKPDEISTIFKRFQDYRPIIAERLAKLNQYSRDANGNLVRNPDGYFKGYTRYSQDVLIPAFIAAYTGRNPNSVALVSQSNAKVSSNPFSGIKPLPNWRVSYNGLTRIPGMEKVFSSFTINHAYNSTLSMNSFNSALLYQDPLRINYPGFIDTLTGSFVPYFLLPNITISEAFQPLIDLDMQFTNQLGMQVGYKKSRQLSLSLVDFQLSEARSTEFTLSARWRKRGLNLPFRIPFMKKDSKKLENDLTFTMDFSYRDDITSNSRLDQNTALPTAGQKVIRIAPNIDYVINNRVKVILYFDQQRTTPKISTSPPIINTRGGIRVNVSLAQ
jgi:cell surface protein SprA